MTHAPTPTNYPGPYRGWGPLLNDYENTGRHDWTSEVSDTLDGFKKIRPHAVEWWDGETWIGID